ncbi:sodium:solute symporter family protein [Rubinisphaera italica]|uniref:Sodium/proline symporter n=1 Tax=Rubinisphaera italica TaxID=2527969 RepID=A0A5C5XCR2_9PLAN|nr:sodium:solute symporter family protein [Rubinisphaera italica]TWT60554.1 Sodium/proline symporter [Rubinisphaera italica]
MTTIDFVVIITYFITMIAIGLWAMRRVKGQEDYFMGGRGFGKLLQTFAAFGAGTGAHEPVQVGRTVWTSGLSGVWSAMMWLFVTPVYWFTAVWYRRMRHLTLGDWFVERYQSQLLGAAYTAFAILFYMFYLSTMLSAIAKFSVPLMGTDMMFGMELKYVLVPLISMIVIAYGVLGGLTAAYWTDLIQGIFIILLSILLIPYGLWELVEKFGDPSTQGLLDGFTILHQRVSAENFGLFTGPSAGEFPPQYIFSLTLLALVGIVVQPHFIATGGGSAKSEDEARIGLVVGNFLKRLCTAGWAITALIALALLAGNVEIAADPDKVWGVAAREILGPLNMGLVGLMLACLLAAMMSSADAYMIVTSALVVRNVYSPYINSNASEKECVRIARLSGLTIIVGATIVSLVMGDVFGQFKLAIELPLLFAAPFWVGIFWRRSNAMAVWLTIGFVGMVFFVLPYLLPVLNPSMRTDPAYTVSTEVVTTTRERTATEVDVARREAWETAKAQAENQYVNDPAKLDAALKKLGASPPDAVVGETIQLSMTTGGESIFWNDVRADNSNLMTVREETSEDGTRIVVQKRTGEFKGEGPLKIDFLIYQWLGIIDLSDASKATLETLRLPPRVILPFVFLMLVSLVTPRGNAEKLNRYYAKMKTEVDPDPEKDTAKLAESYANPTRFDDRRLLPGTDWEFMKPSRKDITGFLVSVVVCFIILALLIWVANIKA